jgi:hypothetical protein
MVTYIYPPPELPTLKFGWLGGRSLVGPMRIRIIRHSGDLIKSTDQHCSSKELDKYPHLESTTLVETRVFHRNCWIS